ncbi:MAG: Fic family protein [Bacteroidales bacterium]|jgi:cell filamentation protein|nr:Fic family protein [Bacteroidales bacterium]
MKKTNAGTEIAQPNKISIRFFNDREVRAVWDEDNNKWWFSVVDVIASLKISENPRNYWKVLKNRLKNSGSQLVTKCNQLKLTSSDGKKYLTDTLDMDAIKELATILKATEFLEWFLYSENTIDGQSKKKAYSLFESRLLTSLEPGTVKSLQQIHAYLFGGLYDFAGQIRDKNISKGGFTFANALHFPTILKIIENMPETTFDEILDKYVEMNIAHPFMEGNGRTTRIWLDLILKRSLKKCVDWSMINKTDYLAAMRRSVTNSDDIKTLVRNALTNKIHDREMFMKGIDYSYYYEENE